MPQPTDRSNRDTGGRKPSPSLQERNTAMQTITLNIMTFNAMYDALNIAHERLVMNNCHGDECPYMAIMHDAIERAEEEL